MSPGFEAGANNPPVYKSSEGWDCSLGQGHTFEWQYWHRFRWVQAALL